MSDTTSELFAPPFAVVIVGLQKKEIGRFTFGVLPPVGSILNLDDDVIDVKSYQFNLDSGVTTMHAKSKNQARANTEATMAVLAAGVPRGIPRR